MSPARPLRESRGQRKSYNHDPFKEHIYESASDDDAGDAASGEDEAVQDSESSLDDFAPPEEEEDEVGEGDSVVDSDEDAGSGGEYDSDAGSETSKLRPGKQTGGPSAPSEIKPGSGKGKTRSIQIGPDTKLRQRVIEEWNKGGQQQRFKTFFGPTVEDMYPVLQTRDHWFRQDAMPCRAEGDLRRSFYVPEEVEAEEIGNTRRWYEDVGRESFEKGQKCKRVTDEEGRPYLVNEGPASMDLLMGDIKQPKVYTLGKGEHMSVSTPFQSKSGRRGWIFNLGTRIQETQWVPNEKGRTQYLAVAVEQKHPVKPKYKLLENPKAPAFTPTKPFQASIQIWAFDSDDNGEMDPEKHPRLENVICTDWGAPKFFRWCPIGMKNTVDMDDGENNVHLGLLAGVWSDGKLRILDISFQKSDDPLKPNYTHYTEAAFEVTMPETIPTCLHWLSGTSLAVATASGNLGIWSFNRPDGFSRKPWFYKQMADTYILSLCSGYPSYPQMVSVTTADGFARLFDLRSPSLDACFAARGRMLVLNQDWHEHTQSFVMADEYYLLKHSSVRRYHTNIYGIRLVSPISCCATSPVHPCILAGGIDGTVEASNTLCKVINGKALPWQQKWFKHEYRPAIDNLILRPNPTQNPPEPSTATLPLPIGVIAPDSSPDNAVLDKPLTRITEGYKAQKLGVVYAEDFRGGKDGSSAKYLTIFEEKSAITKLAWNPNRRCGTWAVAGSNSGYLRVEDIGV
ncbi:hypothetical protein P280DRAFT_504448 [Massarina eburnea CBS 473.64]|uniref:WD40 repeat-like protein n=1 Tax=Massarina eburnea CBS 473.64 TaxID=1395130 RepID=A0A6A6SFF3_9PLEO|nr:hypothetical protein P280DRAFT_504448 [Massarina eburnea CBS 473.64]